MAEYWGFDQVDVEGLIFVSYNSLDWKRVAPIALELRKLGVPVWYDYGLQVGRDDWELQIARHIRISGAMIIFVTKGIFERSDSYVMWEYNKARSLGLPVVPVFLDDVLSDGFYRAWSREQPDSFDRYSTNLDRWKSSQSIVCRPDNAAAVIAGAIRRKLDSSDQISYSSVPWVDTQAEMKRKAEETKARAEREARAEKARQAAQEKARAKPTVRVGARVQFGSYPQSTNEPEPIMWRVLDVINGKALMITENLLDAKQYNEQQKDVTWETCTLRKWLNDDFLKKAFSADEQRKIAAVRVQNPDNLRYKTKGGNPTEDRVFCLSIDEAKKYFSGNDDRKAKPTAYARKNGAHVNSDHGTGCWWLRSPGDYSNSAAHVYANGDILDDGHYVNIVDICVRPVVLASL